MALLWVGLGFAAFGALVGSIAGLSSAELTTILLGLLFALIGGSIGVFLGKVDLTARIFTGVALFAFSIFATVGLYTGIYVRLNNILLTETANQLSTNQPVSRHAKSVTPTYMKGKKKSYTEFLTFEVNSDRMPLNEACTLLQQAGQLRTRE